MSVKIIFFLSVLGIVYAYIGYPLILWATSRFFNRPVRKSYITPSISIVISAHNEEACIERKILNCLELDYPREKLEVLIGSDGSTDRTWDILEKYNELGIKAYKMTPRGGKPGMLNFLVSKARNEIIVFADARQRFDKLALRELAGNFADGEVGCVTGELVLENSKTHILAHGLLAYWDYEVLLRRIESRIYSLTGATGAIYAVRKKLFAPLDGNTILDDVYIPLKIVEQGYRAVVDPSAVAYDEISENSKYESKRKQRTLAGTWQIFIKCVKMFNPLVSPVAIQLFSHKLMRVIMPYFLIAAFVSNLGLAGFPVFKTLFLMQVLFYTSALTGPLLDRLKVKFLSIPYTFCMLNIDAVVGTYAYFNGIQKVTWEK